jgi:hypothetical protein
VAEPYAPRRLWRVLSQPIGGGYILIVAEDLSARDALRGAVFRGSALAILIAAWARRRPGRAERHARCAAPAPSPTPPSASPRRPLGPRARAPRAATSSTTWAPR